MMDQYARRTSVHLVYDGKDITKEIQAYLLDFSYTDNDKEAEDIQLNLENRDRLWLNSWFPKRGDEIQAKIVMEHYNFPGEKIVIPCGKFEVDEITAKGSPNVVSLKAISHPAKGDSKDTKKNKSWEWIEYKDLVKEVAARNKMAVTFEIEGSRIYDKIDQNQLSDMEFIKKISEEQGYEVKLENKKVVVTREKFYIKQKPKFKIRYTPPGKADIPYEDDLYELLSWEFTQSGLHAYAAAENQYKDPESGKVFKTKVENTDEKSKSGKVLRLNKKAKSEAEAKKKCQEALDKENKKIQTAKFTVAPFRALAAKQVMEVIGWGEFDGKYLVMGVSHKISESGYTVDLDCTRVNKGDKLGDLDKKEEGGTDAVRGSGSIEAVFAAGERALGKKYTWGGTDPFRGGADCSGFVTWCYKQAGMDVGGRITSSGIGNNPRAHGFQKVPWGSMQRGDVLQFFGNPGHVGIYAGNGRVLECGGNSKYTLGYSGVAYTTLNKTRFKNCFRYVGK